MSKGIETRSGQGQHLVATVVRNVPSPCQGAHNKVATCLTCLVSFSSLGQSCTGLGFDSKHDIVDHACNVQLTSLWLGHSYGLEVMAWAFLWFGLGVMSQRLQHTQQVMLCIYLHEDISRCQHPDVLAEAYAADDVMPEKQKLSLRRKWAPPFKLAKFQKT